GRREAAYLGLLLRVLPGDPLAPEPIAAPWRRDEHRLALIVGQRWANGIAPRAFAELGRLVDDHEVEGFTTHRVAVVIAAIHTKEAATDGCVKLDRALRLADAAEPRQLKGLECLPHHAPQWPAVLVRWHDPGTVRTHHQEGGEQHLAKHRLAPAAAHRQHH